MNRINRIRRQIIGFVYIQPRIRLLEGAMRYTESTIIEFSRPSMAIVANTRNLPTSSIVSAKDAKRVPYENKNCNNDGNRNNPSPTQT